MAGAQRMFFRIIAKAIIHRRGRVAVALTALVVGSSVAAAMLSVYYDAGRKMSRELRSYGANVMLAPVGSAKLFDQNIFDRLQRGRWPVEIVGAAPYLYVVADARTGKGDPVSIIASGTIIPDARKISPWWRIDGAWPASGDDVSACLVGTSLAKRMGLVKGSNLVLVYGETGSDSTQDDAGEVTTRRSDNAPSAADTTEGEGAATGQKGVSSTRPDSAAIGNPGKEISCTVEGIVTTGGAEDDQVLVSLGRLQQLAGLQGRLSAVAVSAAGTTAAIESLARDVQSGLGVRADVVRQISKSEGLVLGKLRLTMLLVTVLILAAASLSVGTTLTAMIMDRRKEIGTMKAIGAQDERLLRLVLFELGGMGVTGGIAGYAVGLVLAQPIGRALFNSSVTPRALVFGIVLLISITVALVSGIVPVRRIREVQPATILRGD
ncbi:MAG TPA: ABC transporter permease [Blastocatellia bacterium]|nr:ABC transporter permease [Blastocatellia bacterium]